MIPSSLTPDLKSLKLEIVSKHVDIENENMPKFNNLNFLTMRVLFVFLSCALNRKCSGYKNLQNVMFYVKQILILRFKIAKNITLEWQRKCFINKNKAKDGCDTISWYWRRISLYCTFLYIFIPFLCIYYT